MTVNHFAVTSHEPGNLKTELTNAAAHAIHSRVVLAWIADVKDQLFDWPQVALAIAPLGQVRRRFDGSYSRRNTGGLMASSPLSPSIITSRLRLGFRSERYPACPFALDLLPHPFCTRRVASLLIGASWLVRARHPLH
jgi:hypothetical protein